LLLRRRRHRALARWRESGWAGLAECVWIG
jgi:hypothetical protein